VRRLELSWFKLRFPRELKDDSVIAVLSALSGVDARTRLIFKLSATDAGIEHHIGVSAPSADSVTAELRAAIPSLRYEQIEPVEMDYRRRLLWQLAPAAGAIRTTELAPISSSLLASLYPLHKDEAVSLIWTMRPAVRPSLGITPEERSSGKARALRDKLALPGLAGYGELSATGSVPRRTAYLLRRTSSVLRSLATPFGHLVGEPPLWGQMARLVGQRGRYMGVREIAAVIGWPVGSPDLPGLSLGASRRLLPSAALPRTGRVLGVSNFAGITRPVAITPTASTRGLYLLGPIGTGKTSLLKNLIHDDMEQGRGVCVIETNGDLISDTLDIIPEHRIGDVVLLDPTDKEYAVGFNPLVGSADSSLIADQIVELFERLWKSYWGPRTSQIAHMTLLTLAQGSSGSTLLDVARLLTDSSFRAATVSHLDDPMGLEPDWGWFSGLSDGERDNVTAPLRNKLRAFTARPAIRAIIGQARPKITMRQIMEQQKILLVNLPKGLLGAETVKLLGCLVLVSLWQAATERAELPLSRRHPFSLVVDEWQDFAAAPIPWSEMASQGRKFGLALTLAHQNTQQIERSLLETILANARSKAVFALSATDAKIMERLFAPSLTAGDLMALDAYSIAALVALDDGSTARPVTLTTPPPPESTGTAERVREASRVNYARPRAEVEAELRRKVIPELPSGPLGSKPRTP
jgi:hypothetical protein